MTNESNTPNLSPRASEISSSKKKRQREPGTETFQLLDFPSVLLNRVNYTAGYLEIPRLEFVIRILEAALNEIGVPQMQQKLKEEWREWCEHHKARG